MSDSMVKPQSCAGRFGLMIVQAVIVAVALIDQVLVLLNVRR